MIANETLTATTAGPLHITSQCTYKYWAGWAGCAHDGIDGRAAKQKARALS